jgi:hypothetical protein
VNPALLIILVFALWHLGALQSLGMIFRPLEKNFLYSPKDVLLSREHKIGIVCLVIGITIIIGSDTIGLLDYGIFAGTAVILVDAYCVYLAFKRRKTPF